MEGLTTEDQSFLNELRQNALLEREEAYHKLNTELERKTSEIIEKIEKYSANKKAQRNRSRSTSLRESSGVLDFSSSGGGDAGHPHSSTREEERRSKGPFEDNDNSSCELLTLFESGDKLLKRTSSAASAASMPSASVLAKRSSGKKDGGLSQSATVLKSSAISDFALSEAELRHQSRIQKATDSVVNCLQSKLSNYETRLTELHLQHRQKIQENTMLESKVRALEEERERLLRSVSSLQNSIDKQSKQLENTKNNATTKSQVVESMRKEIEALKREQKQNKAQVQSLLTRLNRTTEENGKLKAQNKSVNLHLRELQAESRAKLEEANQKIIVLEQERGLLSSTVAKQAHLLKNLTQQKVMLENMVEKLSKQPTQESS